MTALQRKRLLALGALAGAAATVAILVVGDRYGAIFRPIHYP